MYLFLSIYPSIYLSRRSIHNAALWRGPAYLGLYTILPLPILHGTFAIQDGWGGTLYCAIVWAMQGWGAVPKHGCVCEYQY